MSEGRALTPIRAGGTRPPLYLIHGLAGTLLPLVALARSLDPGRPVLGFEARGVDGLREPFDRVEAIAAAYLDELAVADPRGPYRIAGYSFGGLIALAMGRELRRARREVALAVLDCLGLSTKDSSVSERDPVMDAHARARARYRPGRFDGPLALFRASSSEAAASPSLGWAEVAAGPFEVQPVPGDHNSMLKPPHVAYLGRALDSWLVRLEGST